MKNYIRTTLLAAMLLVSPSVFAAQFSVGIRIGAPPAPRVVRVVPASPWPRLHANRWLLVSSRKEIQVA